LVGSNLIKMAQERYSAEVIASLYGPAPENTTGYTLDPLDLRDENAIFASILKFKPDVVIHAAALMDFMLIHSNRKLGWSIFVESSQALAWACREVNARFVYISSDWVFNGREPLVDEDTPPYPLNFYGIMKVAVERELSVMDNLNSAVARLAAVYGFNYAIPNQTRWTQTVGYGDLVNYFARQLVKGELCEVWTTEPVNDMSHPTLAADAADLVLRLAQNSATGIFHCFGSEPISRLAMAHRVADAFNADHGLIAAVPTDPEVVAQHANAHISIPFRFRGSSDKTAKILGRSGYTIAEGLAAFKHEWDGFDHKRYVTVT
jgi:dTDP-4-dehydrorhamnose reductase